MRWRASLVGAVSFVLFGVANPAYFVGCTRVDFHFGEAEVVGLLSAVNQTSAYRFSSQSHDYAITLELEQARGDDESRGASAPSPISSVAHACGDRTFLRSASACLDTTNVPVLGRITVRRLDAQPVTLLDRTTVEGKLMVMGRELDNALLELRAGDHVLLLRSRDGRTFEVDGVMMVGLGDNGAPLQFSEH